MPTLSISESDFTKLTMDDIIWLGSNTESELLLVTLSATVAMIRHGYRRGLFPMPLDLPEQETPVFGWFCPKMRGVIPIPPRPDSYLGSPPRSLRVSARRLNVTFDENFNGVIEQCAKIERKGNWINDDIIRLYEVLHLAGEAHSVETWKVNDVERILVGGLYGVQFGQFFAGESMFQTSNDASKVALLWLVNAAPSHGISLIDTQWLTPHLKSLGALEIPWRTYLEIISDD